MSRSTRKTNSVAQFISRRIYDLQITRSQLEIAKIAGFDSPSMLSMLKSGTMKLPLDRVEPLARVLECDPAELARLALGQYFDRSTLELFQRALADDSTHLSTSDVSAAATAMLLEAQLAVRDARYAAQLTRSATSRLDHVTERLVSIRRQLEEFSPRATRGRSKAT